MTPTLPPEILTNIVYQVFHHTRHLRTLHSLLCTSKFLFRETAAVLYYDPFQAAQLGSNDHAIDLLFCLIIRLSPLDDDEAVTKFRTLLDIPKIDHPTIDYLNLIVSDDMQLSSIYHYRWNFVQLVKEAGFQGTELQAQDFQLRLHTAFAWTIYASGGRLSRFKRICFPCSGLERLTEYTDQLNRLQILEAEGRSVAGVGYSFGQQKTFKDLTAFIRRMQKDHGLEQLQDVLSSYREDSWGHKQVHKELDDLLPPLTRPVIFNSRICRKLNGDRPLADIDLSGVEKVRTFWGYDDLLNEQCDYGVPHCRNMKSMECYHTNGPNAFEWAVDERRKYDEARRQQFMSDPAESERGGGALLNMPLMVRPYNLRLSIQHSSMISDVMYAFGLSLEEVYVNLRDDLLMGDDQLRIPTYGATWHLPKLRSLDLRGNMHGFLLHERALDKMPSLLHLHLRSVVSSRSMDDLKEWLLLHPVSEPWQHLQLRELTLEGLSSVSFHPVTLCWLPQLESLTITGPRSEYEYVYTDPMVKAEQRAEPIRRLDAPYANGHLWTWDWEMPSLQRIALKGEMASRFQFEWLKHCPKLEVLSLDVWGTCRHLEASDFLVPAAPPSSSFSHYKNNGDVESAATATPAAPSSTSCQAPFSMTLKELHLITNGENSWNLSTDSLEVLLGACGPRLERLYCHTSDSSIVQHLTRVARTKHKHLKRIRLNPGVDERTHHQSGLQTVGRSPFWKDHKDLALHKRFMVHQVPSDYRDGQLWFFDHLVYAHEEDIQSVLASTTEAEPKERVKLR